MNILSLNSGLKIEIVEIRKREKKNKIKKNFLNLLKVRNNKRFTNIK